MVGVLRTVFATLGALLVLVVLVVLMGYLMRHRLRGWAQRALIEVAGPAVVRSLPPRTVLNSLLSLVYGDRVSHEDVLTGVLGGPAKELLGGDTAVSRRTHAHFRLQSIDDKICRSESTWTYEFSGMPNSHLLVIFGTHDPSLASLVTSNRVFPLYELWSLYSEEELEEFVTELRDTVRIGVRYVDQAGQLHEVPPCAQHGQEIQLYDYARYVRLPGGAKREDLRIVQYDLYDLADPDHVVDAVESLTVRISNNGVNRGWFTWSAPFPCYVGEVEFDVTDLPWEGEELKYMVVLSAAAWYRSTVHREWFTVDGQLRVPINSWMLAGHGVTLLWRSLDESESGDESHHLR